MNKYLAWMLLLTMNFCLFPQERKISTLEKFGALKCVPSNCVLVVVVADMGKLWGKLGGKDLSLKYQKQYQDLTAYIQNTYSISPFPLEKLQDRGLDPFQPMGFAFLDSDVSVLMMTIANNTLFTRYKSLLTKKEPRQWREHPNLAQPNIEVLSYGANPLIPNGFIIVYGGKYLLSLRFSPGFAGDRWKMIFNWVTSVKRKRQSLSQDPCFCELVESLPAADVSVYFNLSSQMRKHFKKLRDTIDKEEPNESEQMLKSARREGDRDTIAYWKKRAREETEWIKRYQDQKRKQLNLQWEIAEPLSISAFTIQMDKGALRLEWHSKLPQDSILARGLTEIRPNLFHIVASRPSCLMTWAVKPEIVEELRQRDIDFDRELMPIEESFRYDVELELREILSLFTGEVAMVLNGDIKPQAKVDPEKIVQGSVIAYLKPEERQRAKAIFDHFAARIEHHKAGQMNRDDGWLTLDIPRPSYLTLHDNWAAFTTDDGFRRDLQKSGPKPFKYPDELREVLSRGRTCLFMLLEVRDLICLDLSQKGYFEEGIQEGKIIMGIAERLGPLAVIVEKQPQTMVIHISQFIKDDHLGNFILQTLHACQELETISGNKR